MSYNEILTHIQCDEASDIVWKFCCITAHEGPLKQNHPNYKGSTYNIMIEWENGEITSEPMTLLLVPFMLRKMISLSKKAGRGSKRLPSMRRSCFEWQTKPSYIPTALHQGISMDMRYLETLPMLFRLMPSVEIQSGKRLQSWNANPRMSTRLLRIGVTRLIHPKVTRRSMYTWYLMWNMMVGTKHAW